jgi:hypothetical protein
MLGHNIPSLASAFRNGLQATRCTPKMTDVEKVLPLAGDIGPVPRAAAARHLAGL